MLQVCMIKDVCKDINLKGRGWTMLVEANFFESNVRLISHYSTKSVMGLIPFVGLCAHVFRLPMAEPMVFGSDMAWYILDNCPIRSGVIRNVRGITSDRMTWNDAGAKLILERSPRSLSKAVSFKKKISSNILGQQCWRDFSRSSLHIRVAKMEN